MTHRVRPARVDDIDALYEMAKLTGGGFTNLPPERDQLAAKLARSAEAFAADIAAPNDELYVLVLEDLATGHVRGTAQIFSRVGVRWPFYSYRLGTLSQHSQELNRTFRSSILSLTTDLEGSSEVGGLFLHPGERAGGLGLLLARSRYMFVAMHRERFGARMLAELRGVIDEGGGSPFWDGLGAKFFGMPFQEADAFNSAKGNQFIADLMPKATVYVDLLPDAARAVIGLPHPKGRAAMRMLEREGFSHDGYVDIFDGGPTMTAATDAIRTVQATTAARYAGTHDGDGRRALVAAGRLAAFNAVFANIAENGDGAVRIDAQAAPGLSLAAGETLYHAGR